jgi:arginine exporter protein ArgO
MIRCSHKIKQGTALNSRGYTVYAILSPCALIDPILFCRGVFGAPFFILVLQVDK